MAKDITADLMQALVAKLYKTITGNDDNIKTPRNKFVSWMLPGIPFTPQDFRFCSKGLIGSGIKDATGTEIMGAAEETKELYHQAFVLSKLFDFIPDVSTASIDPGMQQTIWATTQDTISSVYKDVLKYSKVVALELSDKEKQKIQKFRDLLSKQVPDLVDETKMRTEPGPMAIAYNQYMGDYLRAADEYMNVVIDAQSATGSSPEALRRVTNFANKSKFLRLNMEAAEKAWGAQGYRYEYEQIQAYLTQVAEKSMLLYKEDLKTKFENGRLTSPTEGTAGDFYYTTILPGNFATSPGWTRFTYYENDYDSHTGKETSKGSAGGGGIFGVFNFGGTASKSKVEINTSIKATNFSASFEFAQMPICRPWFEPGFFAMRGWTLDELWDLNYDKKVSDGAEKPVGRLVAYPVSALFVRNVRFQFAEADSVGKYVDQQTSGGGAVGWGPFHIGGTYSHGSTTSDLHSHAEGGVFEIPGLSLIGLVNNIIPKSPNTNPTIKPEQFVGGE